MSGLGLTFLRRGGQAHPTAGSDYIMFADAEVERVLMSKGVSSDGVGITKDDAARVTSIGTWFYQNAIIKSFNELVHFTSVTKLENNALRACNALETLDLTNIEEIAGNALRGDTALHGEFYAPNLVELTGDYVFTIAGFEIFNVPKLRTITQYSLYQCANLKRIVLGDIVSIGRQAMYGCTLLEAVVINNNTPPSLYSNSFQSTNSTFIIYVPDAAVDAYKAAATWSSYASRIKPLSEYQR